MRAEIAALHRRLGTTMIYVTHDQVEAMTLGERIVIMDAGVVQQADAPLALYREPANRFVAAFIGSPPMNFLPGDVANDGALHYVGGTGPSGIVELGAKTRGPAVLGFRAEDVHLDGAGPSLGHATLEVVEQMGHESLGYFQLAGARYSLRLPADSGLAPGDAIEPRLRPDAWRLFAADPAGRRLE
jgi:multiple sugar transport system ATP-binding protein